MSKLDKIFDGITPSVQVDKLTGKPTAVRLDNVDEAKQQVKDLMMELIDGLTHHDTNTDELRLEVEKL
jgi:hypothetical protein